MKISIQSLHDTSQSQWNPPRQTLSATPQEGMLPWQEKSLFPYWSLPRNSKLRDTARELRKQGIRSEMIFWKKFKDKKALGWDIDRQVIIDNFIVDFFIPELGLVIEVDGSSHNHKKEHDQERDVILMGLNLKICRISDQDVLNNIDSVSKRIKKEILARILELTSPLEGWREATGWIPPDSEGYGDSRGVDPTGTEKKIGFLR